jgi:hypothetical protein
MHTHAHTRTRPAWTHTRTHARTRTHTHDLQGAGCAECGTDCRWAAAHRYFKESGPPSVECLSYTHDRDYGQYKQSVGLARAYWQILAPARCVDARVLLPSLPAHAPSPSRTLPVPTPCPLTRTCRCGLPHSRGTRLGRRNTWSMLGAHQNLQGTMPRPPPSALVCNLMCRLPTSSTFSRLSESRLNQSPRESLRTPGVLQADCATHPARRLHESSSEGAHPRRQVRRVPKWHAAAGGLLNAGQAAGLRPSDVACHPGPSACPGPDSPGLLRCGGARPSQPEPRPASSAATGTLSGPFVDLRAAAAGWHPRPFAAAGPPPPPRSRVRRGPPRSWASSRRSRYNETAMETALATTTL